VDLREGRKEQLMMDDGGMDSRGYRVTTVRQNMGRTLWWLATEVMVKILGDASSRRRRAREDRIVNGDHLQGTMVWFEEDTERDYSQREDGRNALMVSDGDDGENPRATPIQGDDSVDLRG
jgi:hypothetical protein